VWKQGENGDLSAPGEHAAATMLTIGAKQRTTGPEINILRATPFRGVVEGNSEHVREPDNTPRE